MLEPSTVGILTLVRVSKNAACWTRAEKILREVSRNRRARLKRAPKSWDDDAVFSRLRILYWHPGFQEESLVKVSLMSNNSDTSKIYFVVVFADMTRDLGVMVEHRNSPFVFCNPGFQWLFSLTAVLKIAVGAVQLILYTVSNFDQSTFSWAFCRGNKLFTVLNGLKATLIFVAWRFD